jgi:hypothetical protein
MTAANRYCPESDTALSGDAGRQQVEAPLDDQDFLAVIPAPDTCNADDRLAYALGQFPVHLRLASPEALGRLIDLGRQGAGEASEQAAAVAMPARAKALGKGVSKGVAPVPESPARASSQLGLLLGQELLAGVVAAARANPKLLEPLRAVFGSQGQGGVSGAVLMTKKDYGKRVGFSVRKLDDFIRQGLPIQGRGRMLRVPVAEADDWIRSNLDHAEGPGNEIEHEARMRARKGAAGSRKS